MQSVMFVSQPSCLRKEKDMKNAGMFLMLALIVGVAHAANGQEQSDQEREQLRRDQLHIAVQQICPISGQKLGERGPPLKVTIGAQKEEVFLCCKGCLQQEIDPKRWATIHVNFAKAQRICPIMKKALPQNPKWAIVEGQIVYVCCPPCTKKSAADPGTFLKQVDELYAASLKVQRQAR